MAMARSLQNCMAVLIVLLAAAASVTMVGADEEAAPTITEKVAAAKETSMKEAAQLGESAKTWKDWAFLQAGEWTGKGRVVAGGAAESAKTYAIKSAQDLHSSSAQASESASGILNKWSAWAKAMAGKYNPGVKPIKNQAAEAVDFINKHRVATDEEL